MKAVIEVRYVLQTGFEMDGISQENPLPKTCSRKEAMRQDAKKVSILDHGNYGGGRKTRPARI
jgi:hypothetical protein